MRIGKKHTKKLSKKPAKKKSNRGRKTLYNPKYDHIAEQACAIGADVPTLARMFNTNQHTINNWMRDNYDFFLSIKRGRDKYDTEFVESSLLKRAKGYEYTADERKIGTKKGKKNIIICTKTIHVPPDIGAAIFWLCNRQPQRWKQVSQAKFQQMNLYSGNVPSKGNGKEKPIDGEIDADGVREILGALRESGAFDTGFNLQGPQTPEGSKTKIN